MLRRARRLHEKWLNLRDKTFIALDEIQAVRSDSASFRRMLKENKRAEALPGENLALKINPKDTGIKFASLVGIPVVLPEAYPDTASLVPRLRESEIRLVVKPRSGHSSNDIYIIHSSDDIFDLGRFEKLHDFDEFARRLAGSKAQGWTVEPFLPSTHDERCPAHDLKFYCFYGCVGLVLEVRRHPTIRYCWWNATGERIGRGKRDQPLFQGEGFSDLEKQWAIQLSNEIPVPFMRIDFLRSSVGSFFGEFTRRPGGFENFPNRLDQWLGEMYLAAQNRLMDDLWNGKRFDHFRTATVRDPSPATLAS